MLVVRKHLCLLLNSRWNTALRELSPRCSFTGGIREILR